MNMYVPIELQHRLIYQDEFATIYHGECLAIMIALIRAGIQFDHCITDPPYEAEAHNNQVRAKGFEHKHLTETIDYGKISKSALAFDAISHRRWMYGRLITWLTKRWSITFCQLEAAMLWRKALESNKRHRYVRTMTWYKPNGMPQFTGDRPAANSENMVLTHPPTRMKWNGGGKGSVLTHNIYSASRNGGQSHPTQKPLSLMEELVTLFTNDGDTILDPFGGSGSTAVACKKHRRHAVLIEQNREYCDVAAKRLRETQPMLNLETPRVEQVKLEI